MKAIASLKLAALGLAASFSFADAVSAAPPNGGKGPGNFGGMKAHGPTGGGGGMKLGPQFGNGPKLGPQVGNGPKIGPQIGNGVKVGPQFGNGQKFPGLGQGGNGPKIAPGFGKGGNGPKIDPGFGKGPQFKGNGPNYVHKPWMQKPHGGKPTTVFCKTPINHNYCHQYGVKKSFGYCYHGYDHNHWYCNKWSHVHNCWFYYDYGCSNWYYWCEPDCCYYPASYVPYKSFCYVAAAPVVVAPPVVTTVTTTVTTGVAAASYGAPAHGGGVHPVSLPGLPGE
jgi:hypothetical protein